ncbi:MAG: phage minor head protein [Candidatus Delongbacteria bacterium]
MTEDLAKVGIEGKLAQLGALKVGGYQALDQAGREALAEAAFSLVPTDALDFLSNYQLQLLGKLTDDLVAGIKSAVQVGIAQGEGPAKIARRIGGIVKDPDEFRQAGKTVFRSVQQRAELIARSEVMRAYNQGAVKIEAQVGITRVRWLTAGDERTCPDCGPLDGKEYNLADLLSQPLHPACRCTHVPADISQLMTKEALEAQLAGQTLENPAVNQALQSGDYSKLTVVQLREVAKGKGISIARTKADRITLLAEASSQDPAWLAGHTPAELDVWLKKYKIGALKSKDELIHALLKAVNADEAAKWAATKAAEKAALAAAKKAEEVAKATEAFHQLRDSALEVANASQADEFMASIKALQTHIDDVMETVGAETAATWSSGVEALKTAFVTSLEQSPLTDLRKVLATLGVKHTSSFSKVQAVDYLLDPAGRPALLEQIATKVQAAKEAAKVKKAQKPVPPTSPISPATSPAVQAKTADEAWAELKATNPFSFHSDASELGGAHTKYFYTDKAGDKWLFKPISEEFRAWGDEVAYLLAREVDPDTIEVRFIQLKDMNGRVRAGSIQKMKTGLKRPSSYEGVDLAALSPDELAQLQREHVVDWMISNHDGHVGQFLRADDGHVYGIDKGQLYKFLGKDKLAIDYYPNKPFNAGEPIYNTLMRSYLDGKLTLDLQATAEWIRRAQAIPDAAYREILMPYASRRFAGQPGALEDFLRTALARKNSLQTDFERFYSEIETARMGKTVTFRFGQVDVATPVEAGEASWARGSRINLEEEVKRIRESGWQGRSLPVDKGAIEDQNVLVRELLTPDGGRRTILQFKLRPEADRQLVSILKPRVSGMVADSLFEDPYWDRILAAVKTTNHHLQDKGFNFETLKAAQGLRPELRKLLETGNRIQQKLAKQYMAVLDEVAESTQRAMADGGALPVGKVTRFTPDAADIKALQKAATPPTDEAFTVRARDRWTEDMTRQKGSQVVIERESVPLSEHDGRLADRLMEFEVDLGQGVKAVYKPFQPGETAYALQGRLTVKVDGAVSETSVARAMERLKGLGIEATPSNAVDEELMYLQKVATVSKVDKSPAFLQAAEDAAKVSPEEALRIWREAWGHQLGVKNVTKLSSYNPSGVHQLSTATGEVGAAGTRIQYRFDLAEKKFQKDMQDYVLTHHISNGKSIEQFFKEVLPGNRAFVPTAERFGTGIPIGGMSPAEDLNTGGASYFFTRIAKNDPKLQNVITLKVDMLRRADAISYSSDYFGRVTGNHAAVHRFSDAKGWKTCARNGSNETIFKGPVPVLENLQEVIVNHQAERQRILSLFREQGIEMLPDGRKIEDVIVARS